VFLYNVVEEKKISENFSFTCSSFSIINEYITDLEEKKRLISMDVSKCIFSLQEPDINVILVLQVDKVFQGKSSDSMIKFYNGKKKDNEIKIQEDIKDECNGYEQYKQPFLFGFQPIFKVENNKVELIEGFIAFKELIYIEHSKGFDYLKNLSSSYPNLKKYTKIAGKIKFYKKVISFFQ
jgi:hypothetical protein